MESPHYVVHQNDSGSFVVERTDPAERLTRAVTGGVGAALLWHGARRSGVMAALAVVAGAELLARAWTGKSMVRLFEGSQGRRGGAGGGQGEGSASSPPQADIVETASMASFPASDAPAMHGPDKTQSTRFESTKGDSHVDGQ